MPAINDRTALHPIKIISVGKQGAGKTAMLAPLLMLGYKLRVLDPDKGIDTLINLITDEEHHPYAEYAKKNNIDLSSSSFICIDQPMITGTTERVQKDERGRLLKSETVTVLKPANSHGWTDILNITMKWIDQGKDLGNIYSWDKDVIFVLDTAGTAAKFGYYYHQGINGRLGGVEDGYDHQRDIGGAQAWFRRYVEVLFSASVKCNVIVNCHIDWIDESKGYAQTPQERARRNESLNLEGVPSIIGQALGPKIGKYFNNVYCVERSGQERKIWTAPRGSVVCKRSAWLKDSYDISTGMAEIFCQLTGKPLPDDFLEKLGKKTLEETKFQTGGVLPTPSSVLLPLSTSGNSSTQAPGRASRPAPLNLKGDTHL